MWLTSPYSHQSPCPSSGGHLNLLPRVCALAWVLPSTPTTQTDSDEQASTQPCSTRTVLVYTSSSCLQSQQATRQQHKGTKATQDPQRAHMGPTRGPLTAHRRPTGDPRGPTGSPHQAHTGHNGFNQPHPWFPMKSEPSPVGLPPLAKAWQELAWRPQNDSEKLPQGQMLGTQGLAASPSCWENCSSQTAKEQHTG